MITEITEPHYVVRCDECEQAIGEDEYGVYILFESREEAVEAIDGYSWRLAADGAVTCHRCLEEERLGRLERGAEP